MEWILQLTIVVLCVWGYLRQMYIINRDKAVGTFSIYVPLVNVICMTIKVFFWFSSSYGFFILVQSLILILTHIVLFRFCIIYRKQTISKSTNVIGRMLSWESFEDSMLLYLGFLLICGILTYISIGYQVPVIAEGMAYVAAAVESYIGVPQIVSNYSKQSVKGMSTFMISLWLTNDLIKTVYFIYTAQPLQFILTAVFQLLLDVVLIGQIMVYWGREVLQEKAE